MNEILSLFGRDGFHVADVRVPLVAGAHPGAVLYRGETYILQSGRYVRAEVVNAEAAREVEAVGGA